MDMKCDCSENSECHFSHQSREICDFRDENWCYYPKEKRELGYNDDRTDKT